jgi:hypothetical protein
MTTEIQVWQVVNNQLVAPKEDELASTHVEAQLESWIEQNPDLLGGQFPLMVIDRPRSIPDVGRLDLLCIDTEGTLVIVELKRDSATREAVAQALDYASWLAQSSPEDIQEYAAQYLKEPLKEAFKKRFNEELPLLDCQEHRLLLVAPRRDAAAERILNYLASRYEMDIAAVSFKYAKLQSDEILVRSMLVPEVQATTSARKPKSKSWVEALAEVTNSAVVDFF